MVVDIKCCEYLIDPNCLNSLYFSKTFHLADGTILGIVYAVLLWAPGGVRGLVNCNKVGENIIFQKLG